MGAFDNYMAARIMRDNPTLMQEYLADRKSMHMASQTPYVMGTPPQAGTPHKYPMMEGEQPIGGLWEGAGPQPASPGGLWDESLDPTDRMLRMTQRAGMSGVPGYQDMAKSNLQQRSSAVMGPASNNMGFGAARRMVQDEDQDQFWVGNVTNKATGEMETVYSPIGGHGKTEPKGKVELIDDYGLTSGEKISWEAEKSRIKAESDKEVGFYLDYPTAMAAAEDAVYDIEYTMRDAAELYDLTDHTTAGFGSWIAGLPLTGATDWRELKSTVQSRLALTKMMLLKAASSTGSTGFGALSEKELKILTDNLASLEQKKSPQAIKSSLVKILNDLSRSHTRLKQAAMDDRSKYMRLHKRFKGKDAPLTEKVQRRVDEGAGGAGSVHTTPSGIQYIVED
jgi:hypothetical protein